MSLRGLSGTSVAVSLFRYFYKGYGKIGQKIIDIYCNSRIYRLAKGFYAGVKICFRNSFWGRITELEQVPPATLGNSRAVQYLISSYKRWKCKIIYYLRPSLTLSLAEDTKEELTFSPVRTVSLIIIITILTNAILFVILQKQMELWSFLIRVLFLFVATAGLSCKADWPTIKQNSVFLRKLHIG